MQVPADSSTNLCKIAVRAATTTATTATTVATYYFCYRYGYGYGYGYCYCYCYYCRTSSMAQRQARVFFPLMFMAQDPQIPSRQERRKVNVGSWNG